MNNEPLFATLNAICSKNPIGIKLKQIKSLCEGNNLPKFIEFLLDIKLSDHININMSEQLTNEEFEQNATNIINFLKTKEKKFKLLLFDFKDPKKIESSLNLLCKNLLDLFFLKNPPKELIKRCHFLIGSKIPIESIEDFNQKEIYLYLLHFYKTSQLHISEGQYSKVSINEIKEKYHQSNIPMILNDECISDPKSNESYVMYQLQL